MVFHTILSPEAEHVRALPDIVFWERFCVPRDEDDEEESPSPVEKREGQKNISFQEADSGVHRLSGPDHPARGGPSGGDFDLKNGDVKK